MFKKMTFFGSFLIVVLSVLSSGCSTLIHGVHQDLSINTTPRGVKVRIGDQTCITPCSLNVWRKADSIMISEPAGYTKYELTSTVNVGTYYFGNGITFILPGIIIDGITGAKYSLEPVDLVLGGTNSATAAKK